MDEHLNSRRASRDGFTAETRRAQSRARVQRPPGHTETMTQPKNWGASADFPCSAAVASPLPPVPALGPVSRQINRHTMPSHFRAKSLKTNVGGMWEVSHFFVAACNERAPISALSPSEKNRNTVSSNFRSNPLKRNGGRMQQVRQKTKAARFETVRILALRPDRDVTNLLSSGEAPKMARLMTSVLDTGNFFTPGAACWAFVFKKGSQVDANQGSRGRGKRRSGDQASLGDQERRIHA